MDYKDFTNRKKAFDGFVEERKKVLESIEKGKFVDTFSDLCARAMTGDCIAQDCVAYFFNKGVPDLLMPNFEYYMSWQILAGANGNEFALEKLEFFLNVAINTIIYDEEILKAALKNGNVTKDNALMVISNLLCEGMADELKLDPKKLIEIKNKPSTYTPEINRVFVLAMEKCLPEVVDFLMS